MRSAQLRVVSPCEEDYSAMRGTGATRFCERCEKSVTNLSAMTRADAERFLEANAGKRVCVRYRIGGDGELVFQPVTPKRLAFVAILSLAMAACTGHLQGDDLDSPEDALLCEDAYGYSVLCDEVDEGVIPDESVPADADTPQDDPIVVDDTEPPSTEEGCPIPPPNETREVRVMGAMEIRDTMGDYDVPESPPEQRKSKRAERRQARIDRRLARRQG